MAVSETSICNMSVGWLGGNEIFNLQDDQSTEASLCRDNYEPARNMLLALVDWTFALSRKVLLPGASEEMVGTDYSNWFQLPSDCVTMRKVSADGSFEDRVIWSKEGTKLYANYDKLYLKYTSRITDPALFSPGFVYALACQIAADICIPLTGDKKAKAGFRAEVEHFTDKAAGSDGVQSLPERAVASRLLNARLYGLGGH